MSPTEAVVGMDVAFLAMPHRTTARVVSEILPSGVRVVDLSGDFRLRSAEQYARYYAAEHPLPQILERGQFVYGLPELNRAALSKARYVASPGCFATTIALGLLPLARANRLSGPVQTVAATGSSRRGANPPLPTPPPLRASTLSSD